MIECWEPRRLILGLACLAALMTGSASARDRGVQGTTYEIIERDFRAEILASASKADWASVQDQAKASAERYLDSLPKRVFETASELTIQYVDPSITLDVGLKGNARVHVLDGQLRSRFENSFRQAVQIPLS